MASCYKIFFFLFQILILNGTSLLKKIFLHYFALQNILHDCIYNVIGPITTAKTNTM
jgi:hypothetical protein